MVHCFLTGVQFDLEQGFVLNRREAHDLLAELNDRAASLQRVINQFSPLDDKDGSASPAHPQQSGLTRKKHRLVCKAVADALVPGFPEIKLFLHWPEYHARSRLRRTASYDDTPEQAAVSALPKDENQCPP
ncbi:MAG: hypothetical protein Q7T46_01210 [Polaromonas sp.]|nr:hypothetical protein [Polaromonas sp.]